MCCSERQRTAARGLFCSAKCFLCFLANQNAKGVHKMEATKMTGLRKKKKKKLIETA